MSRPAFDFRGRPNPYQRHACKLRPRVVRVYDHAGRLVAGLCLTCDRQVTAREAIVWGVDRHGFQESWRS